MVTMEKTLITREGSEYRNTIAMIISTSIMILMGESAKFGGLIAGLVKRDWVNKRRHFRRMEIVVMVAMSFPFLDIAFMHSLRISKKPRIS
jgi:hypothetical protein